MNEKEMNLAILAELKIIANEVFAKVKVSKEGTYTAAELWNEKNSFGESIVIDYKGTESEIYTAEIIGEGNYKVVTRKVSLKKLSDKLAVDKKERTYYKSGDIWYIISDKPLQEKITDRIKNEPDYLFGLLSKFDFSVNCELNSIYKALYEAMKSERANSTPEQRKSENEPENTVICEVVTGKNKCGSLHVEQKRIKAIGNGLYKDDDNLYFEHGVYLYILGGYTRGVATFLKGQSDIESKIVYMIEEGGISTESANILYEKLTGQVLGEPAKEEQAKEETHEDYPPEPYNKEKSEKVASLATFKTRNVATSYERFQDRTICVRFQKNMCPNYLRQKVFPAESFQARRKISRFKPLYFVGYTNYHICKENALERKRNGNTSVYRALIRGETKNNILISR